MSRKRSAHRPERNSRNEGLKVDFMQRLLSFFNVFFLLTGLGVLVTAVWIIVTQRVSLLVSTTYAVAAYLLVAAGCLVVFTAVIGFVGIYKLGKGFLYTYIFLLLLIFLMETAAGVLAYLYADQMKSDLQTRLKEIISEGYGTDISLTDSMDSLQQNIGCCGSVLFDDWAASAWADDARITNNKKEDYTPVPDSCCKNITADCGFLSHPSNIYYDGCAEAFSQLLRYHLNIIGGVGLGVCVVQLFGAILSCCLLSKIKNPKYDSVRYSHGGRYGG